MKTVNAHARSQRPLAERSREQAEDSFPVAARYVLSVMEEPEPSTTVGRGQPALNDLLTDELYSFCEETRQTNSAEVNELHATVEG